MHVAAAVRSCLSTIIGAPDYRRYCAHAAEAHPGVPPVTEEEFYRRHLERRYNRVGGRCC